MYKIFNTHGYIETDHGITDIILKSTDSLITFTWPINSFYNEVDKNVYDFNSYLIKFDLLDDNKINVLAVYEKTSTGSKVFKVTDESSTC